MWLFLSVLSLALALAYGFRLLAKALPHIILNLPERRPFVLPPHITLSLLLQNSVKTVDKEDAIPEVPRGILLLCAAESESFAQQTLLRRAHSLYATLGDWDQVETKLRAEVEPAQEAVGTDGV